MKQLKLPQTLLLLVWMTCVTFTYVLIMIPPESRLAQRVPAELWKLRDLIYPLFFSPAIL